MRVVGSFCLVLSCVAALLATTACRPASFPGRSAGSFTVAAALTANSCGAGFQPAAMLTYLTEIRVDGGVSYWHRGDTPIASGTYTADGHFRFLAQRDVVAYGLDAGVPGGARGCTLRQIETIDGTLSLGWADAGIDAQSSASDTSEPDAGVHSTGFTATNTIQISVSPGADCSLIFQSNGGPFPTLPCTATYALTATTR